MKLIKVCEQVSFDVENDAKEFDSKPFTGKTVAEYFGNHGAAINALANVLKEVLQWQAAQLQPDEKRRDVYIQGLHAEISQMTEMQNYLREEAKRYKKAYEEAPAETEKSFVSKKEYEHAVNTIGQLQEQLKEVNEHINDLNKGYETKDNTPVAEQIVNKLYNSFGTDSGILFGIQEKGVVEAIVNFTLEQAAQLHPVQRRSHGSLGPCFGGEGEG